MENNKSFISCDVCQDLIPLVLDDVASKDSKTLVLEHTKTCEICRAFLNTQQLPDNTAAMTDDKNIIKKIKRVIHMTMLAVVLIGGLFGIALTNGQDVFYNSIIMPLVGALSYFVYRKRSYFICLGFTCITYLWMFITSWMEEGFNTSLFEIPIFFTLIYGLLLFVGVIIAALLNYAFRKEDMVK